MAWWMWALVGFGLFACEMLTPGGFYFIFFGVGACVTSALVSAGLVGPEWAQWLVFTVVSLVCLIPLRGRLVRWAAGEMRPVDSLVGEEAVLLDDLLPGGVAKAELRGTTWSVRTAGGQALQRGARRRVARVDGLTLWLEA